MESYRCLRGIDGNNTDSLGAEIIDEDVDVVLQLISRYELLELLFIIAQKCFQDHIDRYNNECDVFALAENLSAVKPADKSEQSVNVLGVDRQSATRISHNKPVISPMLRRIQGLGDPVERFRGLINCFDVDFFHRFTGERDPSPDNVENQDRVSTGNQDRASTGSDAGDNECIEETDELTDELRDERTERDEWDTSHIVRTAGERTVEGDIYGLEFFLMATEICSLTHHSPSLTTHSPPTHHPLSPYPLTKIRCLPRTTLVLPS